MKSPVFIPRPETEQLVGFVIDDIKSRILQRLDDDDVASSSQLLSSSLPLHVLEIGCGSGAISLSLLREISQDGGNDENDEGGNVNSSKLWRMSAIDVGATAIDLTLRNARRLKLESELELRRASVCDVIEGKLCRGSSYRFYFYVVVSARHSLYFSLFTLLTISRCRMLKLPAKAIRGAL